MATILAAIAAGVNVLGLAYANLSPQIGARSARSRVLFSPQVRPVVVLAIVSVAVLFVLTLPAGPPFSPGLTLGWGILIGGLLGLYALFESGGSFEDRDWSARTVGVLSAAGLGPSLVLLIFRGYPNEALMGCALGAVLVAAVGSTILRPAFAAAGADERPALCAYRGVEVFALATVLLVAGMRLGIDHFPRAHAGHANGGYWAFPALLLAAEILVLILLSGMRERPPLRWPILLCATAAGGAAVVVTAVLQVKLLSQLAWDLPLYGLVVFGFIVATLTHAQESADEAKSRPVALSFGAVLLVLAVVAIAFKRLHGYGEALTLLAALPLAAVPYLSRDRSREPIGESVVMGGFAVFLLLVLNRVFVEQVGRGWMLDFQRHYDYLGVVLGIGACFGVLAFAARGIEQAREAARGGPSRTGLRMLRTGFLGLVVALVPLAVAAIWGMKAVNALLIGLVFAQATWMMLAAWVVGEEREMALAVAPQVYFVGAILVAAQLGPRVLALDLMSWHRMLIAGLVTAVVIVWTVADAWGGSWRRGAREDERAA